MIGKLHKTRENFFFVVNGFCSLDASGRYVQDIKSNSKYGLQKD